MIYPDDRKYTKDHEWAKPMGSDFVVGITDHAQSALGDIVFVDLPKVGRELKHGDTFGVVESIKAVSDLYSPISGTVIEVNAAVIAEPGLLNRSPHTDAWLMKMKPHSQDSTGLLSASEYQKLL